MSANSVIRSVRASTCQLAVERRQTISRRSLLTATAVGGFLGWTMTPAQLWARPSAANPSSVKAKRLLILWMNGGPSQFETFDPKPGTETGGEVKAISTSVPGVAISEFLPRMAQRLEHLSLIRNVTSREGDHVRGQYYLHTGFRQVPGFPRPSIGSVAAHQSSSVNGLPKYVTLGKRGYGAAYLGADNGPLLIPNLSEMRQLLLRIRNRSQRLELIRDLGKEFAVQVDDEQVAKRQQLVSRVERLVATPLADSLRVDNMSKARRSRYGGGPFADACLVAQRLLKAGTAVVEVQLDGWDTHVDNHNSVKRLCGNLDQPWAALMDDLKSSGLLEETLVLWMGEFGRTPAINANRGRDHFPRVCSTVIGGAGVKSGQVIGKTDRQGNTILGKSHNVADLMATVLATLGVSADQEFTTSFDSPTKATENGQVISALF